VKWSGGEKGYGFIGRPSGEDVLLNHSALGTAESQSLNEMDSIEFEVVKGPKGLQAKNVVLLKFSFSRWGMPDCPGPFSLSQTIFET